MMTTWPRFPAIKKCCGDSSRTGESQSPCLHLSSHHQGGGITGALPPSCSYSGQTNMVAGQSTKLSSRDRLTARLSDWAHQSAFQASSTANKVSLQAFSLTNLAALSTMLPHKQAFVKVSITILTLFASMAVSQGWIADLQTTIYRPFWLLANLLSPVHRVIDLLGAYSTRIGCWGRISTLCWVP